MTKAPDILILDESTSPLDEERRRRLYDTLQSIKKEMIIIVITHNNDYEIFDKIINLNEYREGTYEKISKATVLVLSLIMIVGSTRVNSYAAETTNDILPKQILDIYFNPQSRLIASSSLAYLNTTSSLKTDLSLSLSLCSASLFISSVTLA